VGIITMGAPKSLILRLREEFGADTFVETGTFHGGTSRWASEHFAKVTTIEGARAIHEAAVEKHKGVPNIDFRFGRTVERLPEVVDGLRGPAVFWLDAHWSGGETAGVEQECPTLEEIAIIRRSPYEHVILVDDARLFTSPPPPPHNPAHWPTFQQVADALGAGRYTMVDADVIVSVPARGREMLWEFVAADAAESYRLKAHSRFERAVLKVARRARELLPI
jgi:hypothetical protein